MNELKLEDMYQQIPAGFDSKEDEPCTDHLFDEVNSSQIKLELSWRPFSSVA